LSPPVNKENRLLRRDIVWTGTYVQMYYKKRAILAIETAGFK